MVKIITVITSHGVYLNQRTVFFLDFITIIYYIIKDSIQVLHFFGSPSLDLVLK